MCVIALVANSASTGGNHVKLPDIVPDIHSFWQPRVMGKAGIHPNLKVIAVPVLATILRTAPFKY